MSSRIQQLAEQALNEYNATYHNEAKIPEAYLEKFAELIVRECMSISSEAMTNDNWPPHMIAKHFGVE